MFSKAEIDDRIRDHRRYHFECRCVACAEAWPTLSDGGIESRVAGLRAEAYRVAAGPVDNKKLKRLSRLADKALRPTKVGHTANSKKAMTLETCGNESSCFHSKVNNKRI